MHAFAQPQRRLDGISEAGALRVRIVRAERLAVVVGVTHHEPVDHDLDRVALVLVERLNLVEVHQLPVDADADEALLPGGVEDPVAFRLSVADQRPEDQDARSVWAAGRMRSTIWGTLWRSISWPFGQCGWPIRANSSRR